MLERPMFSLLSPGGRRGRLSILIFHRVLPAPDPIFPGEASAAWFDSMLGWLKAWFNVLPLDEAVRRLAEGRLPSRAAAITFDDGYADNHDVALPLLRRHGLPATFFIATGFLDGGRMWNDSVIEAVRRCPMPELDLNGLDEAGSVGSLGRHAVRTPEEKRQAIEAVIGAIKYLPLSNRATLVERIGERSGARLPDDLMMTSDQVRALRRYGMQIGGHTVSHPILATLDEGPARHEIAEGKRQLEEILAEPVTLFAYPNGKPAADYAPASVALVRELGFQAAVSTAWGAAGPTSDPFQLPRFTPWDRSRGRFALRLARNLVA